MVDVARIRRRLETHTYVVDTAIALVVLAASLQPLVAAEDCPCDSTPAWGYALVVAECVPLIWRRRYPFGATLLSGMLALAYGISHLPDPAVPFAGLVALYTVAAHTSRRLANVAGALALAGLTTALLIDGSRADVQDVLVNYTVFATAWLLGENARSRRERALQLEARAEQLERTREAEAQRAVVEERNRIARELHDVVAHSVSLMVIQAEAGPVVAKDPQRSAEVFDTISATGKSALIELRRLLGVLREGTDADEPERSPQPGVDAIPSLVQRLPADALDVELEVSGAVRPLPAAVDLSAYRIVQEALTNTVRHAAASRATVTLDYRPDALHVVVTDDGKQGDGPAGNGLLGMRERVALLGGRLTAGRGSTGGWRVEAVLPT